MKFPRAAAAWHEFRAAHADAGEVEAMRLFLAEHGIVAEQSADLLHGPRLAKHWEPIEQLLVSAEA